MRRVLIFALLLTAATSSEDAEPSAAADSTAAAATAEAAENIQQGEAVAEATAAEEGTTVEEAETQAAGAAAASADAGEAPAETDADPEAAAANDIDPADGALQERVNGGCFYPNEVREDFSHLDLNLLSGESNTTGTPEACQAECVNVEACKYFTWWNNSQHCFLATDDSIWAANPYRNGTVTYDNELQNAGSITGPKVCPTFTTVAPPPEPTGMPWWGWLLIVLGVVAVIAGIAFALIPKKEAPKKKKTRAIKPAPVETKTEPVPTYTRVIHTDGRQEQVNNYAPPAGSIYAGNVVVPGRV